MDVWKWEMEMCCSMQLSALAENLSKSGERRLTPGTTVGSGVTSAPRDEMLFDAVRIHARVSDEERIDVIGTVFYWRIDKGDWSRTARLRTFDNLNQCLDWLKDEKGSASKECAEIFATSRT